MLRETSILLALVAMAAAYPMPWWGWPYGGYGGYGGYYGYMAAPYYWSYPGYYGYQGYNYGSSKLAYNGEFKGECASSGDGLYYVDEHSFAYCTNGQKVIQPCAEGSANPPLDHFTHGDYYGFYDFCSVNLVANGYGVDPVAPGYLHPADRYDSYIPKKGYEESAYQETPNEENHYDENIPY